LSEELARKFTLLKGISDIDNVADKEVRTAPHEERSWIDEKHSTA